MLAPMQIHVLNVLRYHISPQSVTVSCLRSVMLSRLLEGIILQSVRVLYMYILKAKSLVLSVYNHKLQGLLHFMDLKKHFIHCIQNEQPRILEKWISKWDLCRFADLHKHIFGNIWTTKNHFQFSFQYYDFRLVFAGSFHQVVFEIYLIVYLFILKKCDLKIASHLVQCSLPWLMTRP